MFRATMFLAVLLIASVASAGNHHNRVFVFGNHHHVAPTRVFVFGAPSPYAAQFVPGVGFVQSFNGYGVRTFSFGGHCR